MYYTNLKSNKNILETIRYFEEQTTAQLFKMTGGKEASNTNKSHYTRRATKSNETIDTIRRFNQMAKVSYSCSLFYFYLLIAKLCLYTQYKYA